MMRERARELAMLARAFRCSVADVKAMTVREVEAMTEVIADEVKAREQAQRKAEAAQRRRR